MLVKPLHPLKHSTPILVIDVGIVKLVNLKQPMNVYDPNELLSNVISRKNWLP